MMVQMLSSSVYTALYRKKWLSGACKYEILGNYSNDELNNVLENFEKIVSRPLKEKQIPPRFMRCEILIGS